MTDTRKDAEAGGRIHCKSKPEIVEECLPCYDLSHAASIYRKMGNIHLAKRREMEFKEHFRRCHNG